VKKTILAVGLAVLLAGPALPLLGVAALAKPSTHTIICPTPTPTGETDQTSDTDAGDGVEAPAMGDTAGLVVFPLPGGTWVRTSPFGWRFHPTRGTWSLHTGADYAAPDGTPVMAIAAGVVVSAGPAGGYGNLILIDHTQAGYPVVSGYAHSWNGHLYVAAGDQVSAGQHIADVGSAGNSTGPHLHLEIRTGPSGPIDPEPWFAAHPPTGLASPTTPATTPGCATPTPNPEPGVDVETGPDGPEGTPTP
jgi:murein DD-endopeptidase MepM/ murein hydrolase activator NlpD